MQIRTSSAGLQAYFPSLLSLHPWDYAENSEEWQLLSSCRLCNQRSPIHQRHTPSFIHTNPLGPDLSGFVSKLSHVSNNARSSLQFLLCSQLKMSQNSHCSRAILRMLSFVNQVYTMLSRIKFMEPKSRILQVDF